MNFDRAQGAARYSGVCPAAYSMLCQHPIELPPAASVLAKKSPDAIRYPWLG